MWLAAAVGTLARAREIKTRNEELALAPRSARRWSKRARKLWQASVQVQAEWLFDGPQTGHLMMINAGDTCIGDETLPEPLVQPVSCNFQPRIFELLSLQLLTPQSDTWKLCGRRSVPVALARSTATTPPVGWWGPWCSWTGCMRAFRVGDCWGGAGSGELFCPLNSAMIKGVDSCMKQAVTTKPERDSSRGIWKQHLGAGKLSATIFGRDLSSTQWRALEKFGQLQISGGCVYFSYLTCLGFAVKIW